MNLPTLVAVSVIFNISLNIISAAGIGPLTSTIGPYTAPTFSGVSLPNSVASAAQCTLNSVNSTIMNNITCNPVIQGIGSILTTVLTFGIFLWGLAQLLPLFAQAILLPGAFLYKFGVAPQVADIFTTAMLILYLYFGYCLITGRYNADIN